MAIQPFGTGHFLPTSFGRTSIQTVGMFGITSLALRGCLQSEASSIFGIILADFRFKLWGSYTKVDITPTI